MRTLEFHFTEALMLIGRDEFGAILTEIETAIGYWSRVVLGTD